MIVVTPPLKTAKQQKNEPAISLSQAHGQVVGPRIVCITCRAAYADAKAASSTLHDCHHIQGMIILIFVSVFVNKVHSDWLYPQGTVF